MKFRFSNKRIDGILTVVPSNVVKFDDELENYAFTEAKSKKLKKIMGFEEHRIVEGETCASDLCVHGVEHLFRAGVLDKNEIDALILITQTPDHFIPPTSNIIQGRLGLKDDTLCMDINQGCAGYILGLFQAFMLLDQEGISTVVILNADTLSRKCSPRDRNIFPLTGDAASVTVVRSCDEGGDVWGSIHMDGKGSQALIIPAGGMRQPSSPQTAEVRDVGDKNFRSENDFYMDGAAVFNFVQTHVPKMIEDVLHDAGASDDAVDYYMFHQPNKFMLKKLADKMKVAHERMPNNIVEHFGNASSVTVPTNITFNAGAELTEKALTLCMAGFGVGLTWASLLMEVGPLKFCELIEYDGTEL